MMPSLLARQARRCSHGWRPSGSLIRGDLALRAVRGARLLHRARRRWRRRLRRSAAALAKESTCLCTRRSRARAPGSRRATRGRPIAAWRQRRRRCNAVLFELLGQRGRRGAYCRASGRGRRLTWWERRRLCNLGARAEGRVVELSRQQAATRRHGRCCWWKHLAAARRPPARRPSLLWCCSAVRRAWNGRPARGDRPAPWRHLKLWHSGGDGQIVPAAVAQHRCSSSARRSARRW